MIPQSFYVKYPRCGSQVRLLIIYPASDPQTPLECRCLPFELDSVSYEAISYVWGKENDTAEIVCNDEKIGIGLQLAGAIRRLRLKMCARLIWADAICINQKDNEEKTHQVSMMRTIYASARRVIVWLGYGDPELIESTMRYVKRIADRCKRIGSTVSGGPERYQNTQFPEELSDTAIEGLRELYENSWFYRVWCIQEIRLNRNVIVTWGKEELPWEDIGLAASWCFDQEAFKDHELYDAVTHADALFDSDLTDGSLLDTLRAYREWNSTDPRDKVYGLLGLVNAQGEVDALNVDYTKTTVAVFADTVLSTMRLHRVLTGLEFVRHDDGYDGDGHDIDGEHLPSWVPNWEDQEAVIMTDNWNACLDQLIVEGTFDPSQWTLKLTGVIYETVETVLPSMEENFQHPNRCERKQKLPSDDGSPIQAQHAMPHPFFKIFQDMVARNILDPSLSSHGGRLSHQDRVLARTLIAGKRWKEGSWGRNDEVYIEFAALMIWFYDWYNDSYVVEKTDDFYDVSKYRKAAEDVCSTRKFFWMRNNTFGLGPNCMQPGDIIVVFYGGKVPYVLRPKGRKYLLIGHVYVDDIMKGQVIHELRNGNREEATFTIF